MTILKHLWRYWVWLCVAFCTTAIVLLLATTIINHFKPAVPDINPADECIDSGGTWDAGAQICQKTS